MTTNRKNSFARSRLRSAVFLLLVIAACSAALGVIGSSRAISQRVGGNPVNVANKIAPWVVAQTANGQQAEFFIVLADQADLSEAAALHTKTKRAASSAMLYGPRARQHNELSSDGCVNTGSSIVLSTS